jgi:hypothetical protein
MQMISVVRDSMLQRAQSFGSQPFPADAPGARPMTAEETDAFVASLADRSQELAELDNGYMDRNQKTGLVEQSEGYVANGVASRESFKATTIDGAYQTHREEETWNVAGDGPSRFRVDVEVVNHSEASISGLHLSATHVGSQEIAFFVDRNDPANNRILESNGRWSI